MIGRFRTVDPGLVGQVLATLSVRALAGRGSQQLEVHDLTIRCLLGPQRDTAGRMTGLVPVFDAIHYGPPSGWRMGASKGIQFTGDINEMERWLEARRANSLNPAGKPQRAS